MKEARKTEIYIEAKRRLELWLLNSSFDEMSVGGSMLRFDMSLGLIGGYPFKKQKWMFKFNKFITIQEYKTKEYDEIITELYNKYNYERTI